MPVTGEVGNLACGELSSNDHRECLKGRALWEDARCKVGILCYPGGGKDRPSLRNVAHSCGTKWKSRMLRDRRTLRGRSKIEKLPTWLPQGACDHRGGYRRRRHAYRMLNSAGTSGCRQFREGAEEPATKGGRAVDRTVLMTSRSHRSETACC